MLYYFNLNLYYSLKLLAHFIFIYVFLELYLATMLFSSFALMLCIS